MASLLAVALVTLLVTGAALRWWERRVRWGDALLALALATLSILLAHWNLVGLAL